MTDNNSDGRTYLQGSIKEQHRQGSLHPADSDMLMDSVSGKGHSQKRLNPAEQSSLSKEPAGAPVQRSLTGEEKERKPGRQRVIIPMAITFVLGILVSIFFFRMFSATSQGTNEITPTSTESKSEKNKIALDAVVDIPDPVLKKAIQDELGIGDRDITGEDALSLTKLEYDGHEKEQIEDITGLSAFTNLTSLHLYNNQLADLTVLAELTNLTSLWLDGNQLTDISALAGLTNLTDLGLSDNQLTDISALAGLTNLTGLGLSINQLTDISALAGLTNLTELGLGSNQLTDISALAGLTNLTGLGLSINQLTDISALAGLTNLTELGLRSNQLTDISALAGLTNLTGLDLGSNQLTDISALAGLTKLEKLYLSGNPVLKNKSREEIMEILSGAENLTPVDF